MAKWSLGCYLVVSVGLNVVLLDSTTAKSLGHSSNCPKNKVAVQPTPGGTYVCRPCPVCPEGMGLSIKCDGQIADSSEIECQHCTPGVNYSPENDHSQCIPCKKCEGQEIKGNCTERMDNRKCVPCERAWFFDKESQKCLHCSHCENMTSVAREKCISDGFNVNSCRTASILPTQAAATVKESRHVHVRLRVEEIIGIVLGVFVAVCLIYGCLVRVRLKEFKSFLGRSPKGREWHSLFFFCPYKGRVNNSGPSVLSGNGHETLELVGCVKEKLKVDQLNAEACRKMYSLLNTKSNLGIGYTTLGGLMGYSALEVKEFESTNNPSKNLVERWSQTKTNGALKLIELLKKMKRDDIVDILQEELDRFCCHCAKCERV